MSTSDTPSVDELSVSQSWALIRSASVGRLAVVVDGHPDIFPLNPLVDHGTIVLRTSSGTKLTAAVGHQVAFEVDGYDLDDGVAWSVVVKGLATEVLQLHEVVDALQLGLFPWQGGPKPFFVRIEPTTVTGRRFQIAQSQRPHPTAE